MALRFPFWQEVNAAAVFESQPPQQLAPTLTRRSMPAARAPEGA